MRRSNHVARSAQRMTVPAAGPRLCLPKDFVLYIMLQPQGDSPYGTSNNTISSPIGSWRDVISRNT